MIVFILLLGINFLKRITELKNISFSFTILAMNCQVDYFAEELDQKYFQQRINRPVSPQAHLIGFWSFFLILPDGYIVVNYSWLIYISLISVMLRKKITVYFSNCVSYLFQLITSQVKSS